MLLQRSPARRPTAIPFAAMDLDRYLWWRWRWVALALMAGAATVALGASFDVPMVPVPMTLQSLAVVVIGGLYGPVWGLVTLGLYLVIGAAGLPVFANGAAGTEPLFSAGAGYLWSFPPAALVAGIGERVTRDVERRAIWLFVAFFLAHALILGLGVWGLTRTLILREALSVGAWPFLPGALVKSGVGAWLVDRVSWRLSHPRQP